VIYGGNFVRVRVKRACFKDGTFQPSTRWRMVLGSRGYYIPDEVEVMP